MSYWRDQMRPIIAEVIRENQGKGERELRRALREAYPFGQRAYHPYKVWLDEIARQTGRKPPLGTRRSGGGRPVARAPLEQAGQQTLFEGGEDE